MKRYLLSLAVIICLSIVLLTLLTGCTDKTPSQTTVATTTTAPSTVDATKVYINGREIIFSESGATDLDLLSVENKIKISADIKPGDSVKINGEGLTDALTLDYSSIKREDTISVTLLKDGSEKTYTVNLMPSTFGDYTVEGESKTPGDYYIASYDEAVNYIFKLNPKGELIFYKKTGQNALDFRKEYNSKGEVRYTYLQYLDGLFCGIQGINPGCVVIMDENYNVIEEVYYTDSEGNSIKIDPHGFIYLDDGHYILTAYKDVVVKDIPEKLLAPDNSAYLAVLYIEEIKNGEILWEFCSTDYRDILVSTTVVDWRKGLDQCYDYVHFNAMDIDTDGNLIVSCRNINSILKLSRKDGKLMWMLGGIKDNFGLTEEQEFSKQHSIILTEDGSYMLFNNNNDKVTANKSKNSTVIRLKIDEENMCVTEFRQVEAGYFSSYMGAIRELDGEKRIYLWTVGGGTDVPEYSVVEYSETEGAIFKFRFENGYRRIYCANKCE